MEQACEQPGGEQRIEPAEKRDEAADAVKVPFGFSRVLASPRSADPVDPLRWEGDDA